MSLALVAWLGGLVEHDSLSVLFWAVTFSVRFFFLTSMHMEYLIYD